MHQTLINAICNREILSFTYSGLARVVQPVAIGISSTGKKVLRCFQIQGGHITHGHEWDLCEVTKISNLQLTGRNFLHEPPGYRRGDKGMISIFAQL